MRFGVFTVGFILSVQRIVGQSVPLVLRRHTRRSAKPAPFYPAGAGKANWDIMAIQCKSGATQVHALPVLFGGDQGPIEKEYSVKCDPSWRQCEMR